MTTPEIKPVLPYRTPPSERREPAPSWIVATLLALPGLSCWMVLAMIVVPPPLRVLAWPGYYLVRLLGFGMALVWFVAIITALISLAIYLPWKKPWYVILNLIVNISGLLFTLVALILGWLK
jgi:hypothetical protein